MPPTGFRLARRSLEFVHPYRRRLVGVVSLALFLASLTALDPLVMKFLFDRLGEPGAEPILAATVAGLLALELARAVLNAWLGVLSWDVRLGVEYTVRERVIGALNQLPVTQLQREGVGGTMNRVNQGIAGYVSAFSDAAFNLLPTLVYLALSVVAMVRLEWRLAVLVLAFTPLPVLIGAWAAPEQTRRERRLIQRWTSLYSRYNEVLAGITTVKGFAMEDAEKQRFLEGVRRGNEVVRKGIRRDSRTAALRTLVGALARLSALALGGLLVARGEMTLGTLVAFLGYVGGLFGPVQGLTNTYQSLRRATAYLETLYGILDAENVVADHPGAADAPPIRGAVEFRGVTFGYHPNSAVLRGIDLAVRPGETVALVGPSGSGKTTLTNLLQRLYVPSAGTITVDGVDIRDLTQRSLRRQIGVVSQDTHLFNDTIRANIAYGRPDATQDEIEAAARAAHAHDFITALPAGYATVVRERGSRLSGGERQRIAIARALLKDPPILILDEATSALDTESEQLIQQALQRLLRGRTAFIVAHRLSTVRTADRIVVLDGGRIVESGTHAELLRAGGRYAGLVARQAAGFLGEERAA